MEKQKNLFETDPPPWEVDDAQETLVATVVLADGPIGEFDYAVPPKLAAQIEPGRRVRIPFGKGDRSVIGYCVRTENRRGATRRLKEIKAVVDNDPLLSPALLRLTAWMTDYYLCTWGQAIETVVPSGVRNQAGTREQTFLHVPTQVAARITQLKLPAKQAEALKALAAAGQPMTPPQLAEAAGCTLRPIQELRKKGLVAAEVRRVRSADHDLAPEPREQNHVLNGP